MKKIFKIEQIIFVFAIAIIVFLSSAIAWGKCASRVRLPLDFTKFSVENYRGEKWKLIIETVDGKRYMRDGLNQFSAVSKMTGSSDYREAGGSAIVCLDDFDFIRGVNFSFDEIAYEYPADLIKDRFLIVENKDKCSAITFDFEGNKPGIKLHCGQEIYISIWDCSNAANCELSKMFRDEYLEALQDALNEINKNGKIIAITVLPLSTRLMSAEVNFGPFKVLASQQALENFLYAEN